MKVKLKTLEEIKKVLGEPEYRRTFINYEEEEIFIELTDFGRTITVYKDRHFYSNCRHKKRDAPSFTIFNRKYIAFLCEHNLKRELIL